MQSYIFCVFPSDVSTIFIFILKFTYNFFIYIYIYIYTLFFLLLSIFLRRTYEYYEYENMKHEIVWNKFSLLIWNIVNLFTHFHKVLYISNKPKEVNTKAGLKATHETKRNEVLNTPLCKVIFMKNYIKHPN